MLSLCKCMIILFICLDNLQVISYMQNCNCSNYCSCYTNNSIICSFKNIDIYNSNKLYTSNLNTHKKESTDFSIENNVINELVLSFNSCDIKSLTISDIFINETHLSKLPRSLIYLKLLNTSINSQSITSLKHLINLTSLIITANDNLTSIDATTFNSFFELQELDISSNNISFIHPQSFHHLSNLPKIDLRNNSLTSLSKDTFPSYKNVLLDSNPWDCNCALLWLKNKLTPTSLNSNLMCMSPSNLTNQLLREVPEEKFICEDISLKTIENITVISYLHTRTINCPMSASPSPSIYWVTPRGIVANSLMSLWFPTSIHELMRNGTIKETLSFRGKPTFYEAKVTALSNGSLLISRLRSYFVGNYTCIAIASDGTTWNNTMGVTITSTVSSYLTSACIIGAFTAYGLSILAVCICLLTICIEKRCLVPKSHVKVLSVTIEPRGYRDSALARRKAAAKLKKKSKLCGCGLGGDTDRKHSTGGWHIKHFEDIEVAAPVDPPPKEVTPPPPTVATPPLPLSASLLTEGVGIVIVAAHPRRLEIQNEALCQRKVSSTVSLPYIRNSFLFGEATSSRRPSTPPEYSVSSSPKVDNLCVTPAEGIIEVRVESTTGYTRSTLESVSARLEKSMDRIKANSSKKLQSVKESSRDYVQSMRDSSEMYASRMRESSSRYMTTILESTGQAANRMRSGVAHSVEQVKYHMQSMKELCGTGTLIQTISMISVSTDVDSNARLEVIKTITFV